MRNIFLFFCAIGIASAAQTFDILGHSEEDLRVFLDKELSDSDVFSLPIDSKHLRLRVDINGIHASRLRIQDEAKAKQLFTDSIEKWNGEATRLMCKETLFLDEEEMIGCGSSVVLMGQKEATLKTKKIIFGNNEQMVYCATNGTFNLVLLGSKSIVRQISIFVDDCDHAFASAKIPQESNTEDQKISVFGITGHLTGVPEENDVLSLYGIKGLSVCIAAKKLKEFLDLR